MLGSRLGLKRNPRARGWVKGKGGGCSTAVGGLAVSVRMSTVAVSPTRPALRGQHTPASYVSPPPHQRLQHGEGAFHRPDVHRRLPPVTPSGVAPWHGQARHRRLPPPLPAPPPSRPSLPPPSPYLSRPSYRHLAPPFRSPPPPHPTAHPHSRRSPCSAARTRPGRPTRTAVARGGPRGWGGTGAAARPARRCRTPPPSPSRSRRAAAGPRGQSHTSRVRPALARAPHEASRGGRGACC